MDAMLDINNKDVKRFSDKLRDMSRSDLPIVVRQTLNNLAFDVIMETLQKSANEQFVVRNRTFFRKFSQVDKANGWNINSMKSEVGIVPGGNIAASQLTKQEYGGTIQNRSMIYMNTSRISGVKNKMVRKQNYIDSKGIVKGNPSRSRSKKSQFVANAIIAKRNNKFMLSDSKSGQTLFDVKDVKFSSGGNRKVHVRVVPIADYEQGRSIAVKSRPFLRNASKKTYRKQEHFFIKNAKKRIEKRFK